MVRAAVDTSARCSSLTRTPCTMRSQPCVPVLSVCRGEGEKVAGLLAFWYHHRSRFQHIEDELSEEAAMRIGACHGDGATAYDPAWFL